MIVDTFISDLKRFGGQRALARDENNTRRREFYSLQHWLAIHGFGLLVIAALSGSMVLAILAVIIFTTGERECRRYRACGRYWQCKRSIEVIGI